MNIEEFVSESLVQIIKGVMKAQEELKGTKAFINPALRSFPSAESVGTAEGHADKIVRNVEFDVAVSVAEGKGTKGGIGIMVGVMGIGSQGQSQSSTGSESRIKFKIPIILPVHGKE